jgi:hypothetical protein
MQGEASGQYLTGPGLESYFGLLGRTTRRLKKQQHLLSTIINNHLLDSSSTTDLKQYRRQLLGQIHLVCNTLWELYRSKVSDW